MKRIESKDLSTKFTSKLGSSKSTKALTTGSPTSKQSKYPWLFNCARSENSMSSSDQDSDGILIYNNYIINFIYRSEF